MLAKQLVRVTWKAGQILVGCAGLENQSGVTRGEFDSLAFRCGLKWLRYPTTTYRRFPRRRRLLHRHAAGHGELRQVVAAPSQLSNGSVNPRGTDPSFF